MYEYISTENIWGISNIGNHWIETRRVRLEARGAVSKVFRIDTTKVSAGSRSKGFIKIDSYVRVISRMCKQLVRYLKRPCSSQNERQEMQMR
jgi:hypothetical protein